MTQHPSDQHDNNDRADLNAWHQQRDQAAFARLVKRHHPLVARTCARLLHRLPHLQDDAIQASFVLLDQYAGRITNPEHLPAWLHRVATRAALRCLRDHTRGRSTPLSDKDLMMPEQSNDPWNDARPHLDAALDELTDKERTAVIAFYLHGQTQASIATAANCSVPAIKMRLQSGLERLRRNFRKRGIVMSLALLIGGLQRELDASEQIVASIEYQPKNASKQAQQLAHSVALGLSTHMLRRAAVAALLIGGLSLGGLSLIGSEAGTPDIPPHPPHQGEGSDSPQAEQPAADRQEQPVNKAPTITVDVVDGELTAVVELINKQVPGSLVIAKNVDTGALFPVTIRVKDIEVRNAAAFLAMLTDLHTFERDGIQVLSATPAPAENHGHGDF